MNLYLPLLLFLWCTLRGSISLDILKFRSRKESSLNQTSVWRVRSRTLKQCICFCLHLEPGPGVGFTKSEGDPQICKGRRFGILVNEGSRGKMRKSWNWESRNLCENLPIVAVRYRTILKHFWSTYKAFMKHLWRTSQTKPLWKSAYSGSTLSDNSQAFLKHL